MRAFRYVGGASSKFWETNRDDAVVTVRFGRIGTNGQTQTKALGAEAKARAHVDRPLALASAG
jgi:predicted DNA-binding WGR domain protein